MFDLKACCSCMWDVMWAIKKDAPNVYKVINEICKCDGNESCCGTASTK